MTEILFVCTTNRAVSPIAAAYFADAVAAAGCTAGFTVVSAGLNARRGVSVPEATRRFLAERGIPLLAVGCRQLTQKDIRTADLVVATSSVVAERLKDDFHAKPDKLLLLMALVDSKRDVFEPRSTRESNSQCLDMMKPALDYLLKRLL